MASRRRRAGSSSGSRKKSARSPRRRPFLIGFAIGLIVLVGVGVLLAVQASKARDAIDAATDQATRLQSQIVAGDTDGARAALKGLQRSTTTARTNTDGPLWGAISHLPGVGDSVDAVQTSAASLDDIAQRALPPLVDTSAGLDAKLFQPKDGAFDVDALEKIADPVTTASQVLTENKKRIDTIDTADLLGSLRGPVTDLKQKVNSAQSAAAAGARGLRLAPDLLGADGKRSYLLLFQNNAEARSTGGIPGAYAVLRAKNGKLTIGEQGSIDDLGTFSKPVLELTDDELKTYGSSMGTDLRDVNLTPDFPRTAQLAREMISRRLDVKVDGVFSVDPVALSYALAGTGSVKVSDGTTLTADNAADVLLNGVYTRFADPRVQDAYFADSARRVFDAVLSGRGDAKKTLAGLAKANRERRIMMWSADETEEVELAETRLAGELPAPSSTPHVGAYVSDATSSKMQYYLRTKTTVASLKCSADGAQELTVTTTLRSVAPKDASDLPEYITGNGQRIKPGSQVVNLRMFAPAGASIEKTTVDGKRTVLGRGAAGKRPVLIRAAKLGPGDTATVEVTLRTADGQSGDAVVTSTPGVVSFDQDATFASACS
jgi:hypothetical protein